MRKLLISLFVIIYSSSDSQNLKKVSEFRIEHIGEQDHNIYTIVFRTTKRNPTSNEIVILVDKKAFQTIQSYIEANKTESQKRPVQKYGTFNIIEKFDNGDEFFYTIGPKGVAKEHFVNLKKQVDTQKMKSISDAVNNLIYRVR